jgi:hypothetical protein
MRRLVEFQISKPRHHNKLTIAEPMVTSTIVEMPIDGLKAPLICQHCHIPILYMTHLAAST